jgi:hypothetical protein
MALATVADYFTVNGEEVPEDLTTTGRMRIEALLEDAADQVAGYLRLATYAVNADGAPTDFTVTRAIIRAECKQARYFEENPAARTESVPQYDSISQGSLTLSNRASTDTAGKTSAMSEKAYAILLNAGLLSTVVHH